MAGKKSTPKASAGFMTSTVDPVVTDRSWVSGGAKYPWEIGCKCDVCYLGKVHREAKTWRPVMPEINPGSSCVILAENPGRTEVASGIPLCGKSGKEIENALVPLGLRREDFSWDNAALCLPPGLDTRRMLADMARENRKLEAAGKPKWLSPFDACQPHVTAHVLARPNVLAVGKYAITAVTGRSAAVRKVRGSLVDLWTSPQGDQDPTPRTRSNGGLLYVRNARVVGPDDPPLYPDEIAPPPGSQHLRVVPTVHPAFVLREPAWRPVFRQDVGRFWRWLRGELRWEVPRFLFNPSVAQIADFLYGPGSVGAYAYDVETDGKESNTCNLRCIGIARPEGGIVIPFLGTQRTRTRAGIVPATPYTPINQAERMIGRRVFADWWAVKHGTVEHDGTYYTNEEATAIHALLVHFLLDPNRVKVTHNGGYFDASVLIRELDLPDEPRPLIDTILYFRGCHSELLRDLFTLGTLYTDVPDWKAASDERKIAVNPRDDVELATYCNIDTTVTIRVAPLLVEEAASRGQLSVIQLDHAVQSVYRDAHRLGMRMDEPRRVVLEENHAAEEESLLRQIRDLVGGTGFGRDARAPFNPYSTRQLSRLFFDELKLPVLFKTETGESSVDDDTLRAFILQKIISGKDLELVKLIRRLRKIKKELSTYLLPWRRWNDYRRLKEAPVLEESDLVETQTGRKKRRRSPIIDDDDIPLSKEYKGGLTQPDGRIHMDYNVHTARTGRASSSNPNGQNVGKHLRTLFIPEGGNCFIGFDFDQIELRLVATLARLERYVETIRAGGDPHALTAELLYGATFLLELRKSYTQEQWDRYQRTGIPVKASGKLATKQYVSMRVLAKQFIYAVIYGGSARTIYESVSSAEDDDGELLFPDMTYAGIRDVYDNFMHGLPQLGQWWENAWVFAQQHFHVREPVGGRRRDFPAFERNEIPNMLIQGAAAIIMSRGLVRLRESCAPNFGLRRGIVNQCHDAVVVECGRHEVERVKETVQTSLRQEYFGMEFVGQADDAEDWAHA